MRPGIARAPSIPGGQGGVSLVPVGSRAKGGLLLEFACLQIVGLGGILIEAVRRRASLRGCGWTGGGSLTPGEGGGEQHQKEEAAAHGGSITDEAPGWEGENFEIGRRCRMRGFRRGFRGAANSGGGSSPDVIEEEGDSFFLHTFFETVTHRRCRSACNPAPGRLRQPFSSAQGKVLRPLDYG